MADVHLVIAGGRDYPHDDGLILIASAMAVCGFLEDVRLVYSGACGIDEDDPKRDALRAQGADGAGEAWAKMLGIPVERVYAPWRRLGRKAGPIRNAKMADKAGEAPGGGAALLLPGHDGTASMLREAKRVGLTIIKAGWK